MSKVQTSFDLKVLRDAATRLRDGDWVVPNIEVPRESHENYGRVLAERVYCGLRNLQQNEPKVEFVVSASELRNIPGVGLFLDHLDEPALSARMSSVDIKLQLIMDKLQATEQLEGTVAGLAKTVDELKDKLREQQGTVNLQVGAGHQPSTGLVAQQQQQSGSWASRAAGFSGMGRVQALQQGVRNRSVSSKRGRSSSGEDRGRSQRRKRYTGLKSVMERNSHLAPLGAQRSQELGRSRQGISGEERRDDVGQERRREEYQTPYTLVSRRKRTGAVQKGSGAVEAEGGVKAPISVFVSGTAPSTTEDIVREKLLLCAAKVKDDGEGEVELLIQKVEHIAIKIPTGETPRSRCWKVTVAPEFADHMLKSSAYPASWGWRRWNRGPAQRSHSQQGARVVDGGA